MLNSVKVGVAGAGVFGSYHAQKFANHDRAELVGVYDIVSERAEMLAAKCGARAFSDFAAMTAEVDAVAIVAPAVAHGELSKAALEANKHVLVEKPIAATLDESTAMIALARSRNLILQVGHQERYVAAQIGLLDIAETPVSVRCVRKTGATGRCEDVSVIFDLMIHDLDIVRQVTQAEIASVRAAGDEHEVDAEIVFGDGATAVFTASRRATQDERSINLVYADGEVVFDFANRRLLRDDSGRCTPRPISKQANLALTDPLAFGANAFVNSILNHKPPTVTGVDGRIALDWALRINAAVDGVQARSTQEERLMA